MKIKIKNNNNKNLILLLCFLIIALVGLLIWQKVHKEGFFAVEKLTSLDDIEAFIYINLENREDRKSQILGELEKLGIPSSRIYKVSGVYIPDNGHKGCVQSHILALNMAKLNNWNNVMILEDDAELTMPADQFRTQFKHMLDYLNLSGNEPQFDVLMLATANATKTPVEKINGTGDGIVRLTSATTASAYVIKHHYLDKMINLFTYLNGMMDASGWTNGGHEEFALDQNWQAMQRHDIWYAWQNDLIQQRNSASTTNQYLAKLNNKKPT